MRCSLPLGFEAAEEHRVCQQQAPLPEAHVSEQPLPLPSTSSPMAPSVPRTPRSSPALQDEHMLIFISGFPSPRYFPSNSESHPPAFQPHFQTLLSPKNSSASPPTSSSLLVHTHVATLISLSQAQLHARSLPDSLLPVVHSTPSLPKLVQGALSPPLLSPFSPLLWAAAQIPCLPCSSSTAHVPSPAGHRLPLHPLSMFPLLVVHLSPQLTISLPDLYNFPQSVSFLPPLLHFTELPSGQTPAPLLLQNTHMSWKMGSRHCKVA